MTVRSGATRVVFIAGAQEDYGRRLARYRWKRALRADGAAAGEPTEDAAKILSATRDCVLVAEETAIPAPLARFPIVEGNAVAAARAVSVAQMPPVHTLREIERAQFPSAPSSVRPPAVAFSTEAFSPASGQTLENFFEDLLGAPREELPEFCALVLDDPFGYERPEVTRHLPQGIRRLLDVGCGAGEASAALKQRSRELHVTGIEKDPRAAGRARAMLDRVLEGEAQVEIRKLAQERHVFDAFLFADVLEHLEDPIAVLSAARSMAADGATLVASVPNVGHLSIVRDLVLGRFDPLPAGLLDSGHLRWFTRSFLGEALTEGGWSVGQIEGLPGALPPDADDFQAVLADFPGVDRASLATYQWVAVAHAG